LLTIVVFNSQETTKINKLKRKESRQLRNTKKFERKILHKRREASVRLRGLSCRVIVDLMLWSPSIKNKKQKKNSHPCAQKIYIYIYIYIYKLKKEKRPLCAK
jgi:hypothetical protein